MNLKWNYAKTTVSASIADRTDECFNLVLAFKTNASMSMESVIGFVATSLLKNGIRYWEDDNAISDLNHDDGCMMVFAVSGSPKMLDDLANQVSVTRDGGFVRVSIPCGAY
jgi:hypothetical protein